jgi:hypothetical protein
MESLDVVSSMNKAIVAYGVGGSGGSGSSDWSDITNKPALYYTGTFTDSTNIVITHNMRKYPSIRVIDTGGTEWHGGVVTYTDLNNIKVKFSYLFGGTIYLT